jgi:phage shock protein PspC (stress-responsive transcriptional regulator)
MFCSTCGNEMPSEFRFCPQCGAAAAGARAAPSGNGSAYSARSGRTFVRPRNDRQIAGVAAGIAQYLDLDVTLVRVLLVCLSVWPPLVGLVFYLICWIVVPNEPYLLLAPLGNPPSTAPSEAPVAN